MTPERLSERTLYAKDSLYPHRYHMRTPVNRGPVALRKSVRASKTDRRRYASFEEASQAFNVLKQQLAHLKHTRCELLQFKNQTTVAERVSLACKYRGIRDDSLLFPQIYITAEGQKVVHCLLCEERFSVANCSKAKLRHSSSDEHLGFVACLLHIESSCLRNVYRCYFDTCNWTTGGEREDAMLKHIKVVHLKLKVDEPIPPNVRESLENRKIAFENAALDGSGPEISDSIDAPRLSAPVSALYPSSTICSLPSSSSSSSPESYPALDLVADDLGASDPTSQFSFLMDDNVLFWNSLFSCEAFPELTSEVNSGPAQTFEFISSPNYSSTLPHLNSNFFGPDDFMNGLPSEWSGSLGFPELDAPQTSPDAFDLSAFDFGFPQDFDLERELGLVGAEAQATIF